MLEVLNVDWNVSENAKSHNTDKYELSQSIPIFRRSQPFKLSITFNREFNEIMDNVRIILKHEISKDVPKLQSLLEDTTVMSSNKINRSKNHWSTQLVGQNDKTITILVRSPPIAAWGLWNLLIKISHKLDPKIITWKCPSQFWLLFNPWDKDDEVYMPDTRYLDEYILNDVGKVYTKGGLSKPKGMHWVYGQFAQPILPVLNKMVKEYKNYLDEEQQLDEEGLGSPLKLCKALMNVNFIVEGKWGGDFSDGTKPWMWTGSLPIYSEFAETGKPVKYGQCYVYASVFTTALRAAGIPARSVSNFVSATGGYRTLSVDDIFDSNGDIIESPSIWNFHVWTDAWMARYDLPPGFGGWQACDCMSTLGPAPVLAIKQGEIGLKYNVKGILAECNCDRVRWSVDDNGEYKLISVDTKHVGKAMLTKQPFIFDPHGDNDFEDLINIYKEPEGSKEERMTMFKAIKYCKQTNKEKLQNFMESAPTEDSDEYEDFMAMLEHIKSNPLRYAVDVPLEQSDVEFKLVQTESIMFGDVLKVILQIENTGDQAYTVDSCLGCSSIYYNSVTASLIKRNQQSTAIQPNTKKEIALEISAEEYASEIVEFTLVKVHCISTVKENNYTWANDYQLNIDMPEIVIKAKDNLQLNKEGYITFHIKNLLKTKLTKCSVTYEAPGIARNKTIQIRDILAGEEIDVDTKVNPNSSGQISINAVFNSKQLNFLAGSAVLDVD